MRTEKIEYCEHLFLVTEDVDADNDYYYIAKCLDYPNIVGGGSTGTIAIRECIENLFIYLEYLIEEMKKKDV